MKRFKLIIALLISCILYIPVADAKSSFSGGFKSPSRPSVSRSSPKPATRQSEQPKTTKSTFGSFGNSNTASNGQSNAKTMSMTQDMNVTTAKANAVKTYNARVAAAAVATGATAVAAHSYLENQSSEKPKVQQPPSGDLNNNSYSKSMSNAGQNPVSSSRDRQYSTERAAAQDNTLANAAVVIAATQAIANSNRDRELRDLRNRQQDLEYAQRNSTAIAQTPSYGETGYSSSTPTPKTAATIAPSASAKQKVDEKEPGSTFWLLVKIILLGGCVYILYRMFFVSSKSKASANQSNYTLGG